MIISADNKDRLCYCLLPFELGMGTKVQYNYLPGYYSTRDLNEDDAVANGQFCVNYDMRLANGYIDYDKEALKQMMLNHEAIFRKQVHELHRLYIKQRELMEELKQKEQFRYALQSQPSIPSPSSLHTFTKSNTNMQPIPRLWEVNCKNNGQSVSGREIPEQLKVVNNESRQASAIITDSGDSLKKSDLDTMLGKHPRVVVDLQLPAYAYIDNGKDKMNGGQGALPFFQVGGSPALSCDFEFGKDLKLTLGSGGISCRGESCQNSLRLQDAQSSRDFSNLNDPILINGTSHGVLSMSSSRYWQGKAPYEETNAPKSSFPLSSTSLNMKNLQEHKAAVSPLLRQKSFANEPAFAGRSSRGVSKSVFSVHNMLEHHRRQQSYFEKPSEPSSFLLSKHTKMEAEFKEKLVSSNDLFRTCLGDANHSASSAPYSRIPIAGGLSVPSSSNSFQVKPTQGGTPFAPIDVDALPLLNKSIPLNHGSTSGMSIFASGCASDKFLFGRSLTSNGSFSSEVSPYPNIFLHDLNHLSCLHKPRADTNKASLNHGQVSNNCGASSAQDDFSVHGPRESVARAGNKDMNTLKTVDLNLDLSADCPDKSPSLQETVPRDHNIKNLNLSGGFSWFKLSPSSKQPQSKLDIITSPNFTTQEFGRTEPRKIISWDAEFSEMRNSMPVCPTSKDIHGVDAIHQGGQCRPDLSNKTYIIDLEKPVPSESYLEDDANDNVCKQVDLINLNIMPCDTPNFGYQIDLEAIPGIDDDALCCKEILEPDQLFVPSEVIKCGIGAKEDTERPQQGATRAAEIIVAMSADTCRNLDITGSFMLNATSAETLVWFANVVCSNVSNLRNIYGTSEDGDVIGDSDSDGIDFFESMTLKLKETKPEDHWVDQPTQKDVHEDEAGFASLLVGKPKRGQTRKRRQKRDFLKDIMPGLASLSRQEATEDFQTIGRLMRASGQSWEIGTIRRNGGRNGTSRPRGGRRARGGSSAATKIKASPTPALTPNNTELAMRGMNMVGWGRTRRCRRARFPSGTVALLRRE